MDFLRSLGHPEEIYNLVRFRLGGCRLVLSKQDRDSMSDSLQTCYKYLNQTGRSFAAVINSLDGELRNAVCIFYLMVRALDTVEDDMTLSLETKIPILHKLHTYLYKADWRFTESKAKHCVVLEDFPTISLEFRNLAAVYQKVIVDICQKMGVGMAEFLEKQVESLLDWDKYCHYAGGLPVIGLSRLFSASGLEDAIIGENTRLSDSVGLFLQKTNIVRDYLEDQLEGREFWPREVWSKYGKNLSDFAKPENIVPAVQCLNELVTNTLQHVPDVLLYLSWLRNQSVFNFCSIPLVMSLATLAAFYNNQQVFKGVVKIRKGQTVTLMMNATNMKAVRFFMYQYTNEIYQKIPLTDPSSECTQNMVSTIKKLSLSHGPVGSHHNFSPIYRSCVILLAILSWQYLRTVQASEEVHTDQ
ncbi:squalene synthase-like [Bufo gargarizans]|uniref:squalene synthase-like n=1 Tax=Bufo gargarizans TaxID=30331 RepID=UPI001CF285E6|nr:squalene synthase-like [Bufo gargarizans]